MNTNDKVQELIEKLEIAIGICDYQDFIDEKLAILKAIEGIKLLQLIAKKGGKTTATYIGRGSGKWCSEQAKQYLEYL